MTTVEVVDDDTGELILGSIVPRLYTPPLVTGPAGPCGCGCALTPETSYGFAVVRFAEGTLGRPLWPWQRWLVIHAGELTALGIPRFRRVIVTVGRQSGKTEVVLALSLFWLFEQHQPSVLGTSTLLKYAKKPWRTAFNLACALPGLLALMPESPRKRGNAIRSAAGEEEWWTAEDCHYAIAASNDEGGRSMTNHRVVADEFAKQHDYGAYSAAYYSMDAVEDAQYWALTTPDPRGEPYNDLRAAAIEHISNGGGDPSLGLFEWSSAPGSDPTDLHALGAANPSMNRPGGKKGSRLLNEARAAMAKGGKLLQSFLTEIMCVQVDDPDHAFDMAAWADLGDPAATLDAWRERLVVGIDVAPDGAHATMSVAALDEQSVPHLEIRAAWSSTEELRTKLPALIEEMKPRAVAWYPNGPAAAVAVVLRALTVKAPASGKRPAREDEGKPIGIELTGALVGEALQGFADLVTTRRIGHNADPLLSAQMQETVRRVDPNGGWTIVRRDAGHVDAVYSAAAGVQGALTLPPPVRRKAFAV